MLESLTIRNYAIIDEMTAEFEIGLNVITGETGAGKSIVVDALEHVLGARASSDLIRAGAEALEVSGVFTFEKKFIQDILPFIIDDEVLILRREVRLDGNNRCFINDHPVTLRLLKELGNRLVDLHGQHDHQSLLDISKHVTFLDGYGRCNFLSDEIGCLYDELLKIRHAIDRHKRAMEAAKRNHELYIFQLDEIERAKLSPGEEEKLVAAINKLSKAVELKTLGFMMFQQLSEVEGSVVEKLGELSSNVRELSRLDSELKPGLDKMAELVEGVEDLSRFFRIYAEKIEDDPGLITELEDRLAQIERLKKKYGPRFEDVIAYSDKLKLDIERVENSEQEMADLETRLKEVESRLAGLAQELTCKRRETAPHLSHEVELHLAELGMNDAHLVIEIKNCESSEQITVDGDSIPITRNGFDQVEFLITANPGEPPRPLVKIASGGEISRVMLSLKLALTDVTSVPTMVFDEIDVGVSGRVAEAIGKKLRKLTEKRQALVITHLPQIAVMAHRHFSARKAVYEGRTRARLVLLDDEMRQRELASLLSGEILTDTALTHAKELMDAQEKSKVNNQK